MRACVQGEVEQISLMKPKAEDKNDTGLLEYLEDIIGEGPGCGAPVQRTVL